MMKVNATKYNSKYKKIQHKYVSVIVILGLLVVISIANNNKVLAYNKANPWNLSCSLCKFRLQQGPIWLRHNLSTSTIFIPISPRLEIKRARLRLVFYSSIADNPRRSSLKVLVNGIVVAQIPLGGSSTRLVFDVNIPKNLLKLGYNCFKFQAVQHYASGGCEDPNNPELWTEIDTLNSKIELDAILKPVRPSLGLLNEFVDKKLWNYYDLTVITPNKKLTRNELRWGALVSMAVAERLKFLKLNVKLTSLEKLKRTRPIYWKRLLLPKINFSKIKGDAVLIGTRDQLKSYLPKNIYNAIKGAFLGMYTQNNYLNRYLLIVSGKTPQQVTKAATVLDFLSYPLPDRQTTIVDSIKIPKLPLDSGENRVTSGATYTFKSLGLDTITLKNIRPQNVTLTLWLPPDLYTNEYKNVKLRLHIAYGAGLRRDSVLNIYLNNHFQAVIHLNNPDGARYQGYEIDIPFRSFQPGPNAITFQPRLIPSITGSCVLMNRSNLLFTLFGDSTVTIPNAQHLTELPNLKLFQNSGFPLNKDPYGSNLYVLLTNNNPDTIATAWMLLGKLTQITGVALYKVSLGYDLNKSKDMLVVGTTNTIDSSILQNAPITFGDNGHLMCPSPLREPQKSDISNPPKWLPKWMQQDIGSNKIEINKPEKKVYIQLQNSLGRNAIMMEFESPFSSKKTVLCILAMQPSILYNCVKRLLSPNIWYNIFGETAIWNVNSQNIYCQLPNKVYLIGTADKTTQLTYIFSRHPLYWFITLAILFGLLIIITAILLSWIKRKRTA